ncbi:MAG: isoprenylcysteine carboxylmethyltransferase family protein [Chloroflexota bacterium]
MPIKSIERRVRQAGAVALVASFVPILVGIWRGLRQPKGQAVGPAAQVLRGRSYLLIGVLFFVPCILLWRPLPLRLSRPARLAALVGGALLYFSGLALALWGRLALGRLYNVSSSLAAQLYSDHQLVTGGPYAYVRHPMYLGIIVAACGSLLLYRAWTTLLVALAFLGLPVRARREEQVLAAAFGPQWQEYCHRVPGWIPIVKRET